MIRKRMLSKRLLVAILVIATAFTMIPLTGGPAYAADGDSELTMELVESDNATYIEGKPIKVKATGSADSAWVGLYKEGEKPGKTTEGGTLSLSWYYVKSDSEGVDNSGVVMDLTKCRSADRPERLVPGNYSIKLFGDGGYSKIVDEIPITIIEDPNQEPADPSDELTLNLVEPEKTTYKQGEPIMIVATGNAEGAWVGMYREDETPRTEVSSLRWYYISNYNGVKVDITSSEFIVNNSSSIAEGDYKILLFGDGGYDQLIEEIHIKVEGIVDIDPDDFTLESDKTQYAYKENIKVKASGTGIGNSAWVGLYPAETVTYGGSYLYYYYVREFNDSWTIIQNRTKGAEASQYVGDGKYKLVIFADSGYGLPAKTVEISVVREVKSKKVIRDPGCLSFGIEYVTYDDGTTEFRTVPSFGDHLWGAPVKIEGTAKHQYTCERDADHVKTEACSSSQPGTVLEAATINKAGKIQYVCDLCGNIYTRNIPKIAYAPKLSSGSFVYDGQTKAPTLDTIVDIDGNVIDNSMYSITCPNSINVGSYTATVTFKDRYDGSSDLTYKIIPRAVTMKKVAKAKKAFKATWSKASAQTSGYQIAYSLKSNFSGAKYKKVKGISTTSTKVKKLKGKKKYYVKVRAYKVVNGQTYYSVWSAVKTVKTKK